MNKHLQWSDSKFCKYQILDYLETLFQMSKEPLNLDLFGYQFFSREDKVCSFYIDDASEKNLIVSGKIFYQQKERSIRILEKLYRERNKSVVNILKFYFLTEDIFMKDVEQFLNKKYIKKISLMRLKCRKDLVSYYSKFPKQEDEEYCFEIDVKNWNIKCRKKISVKIENADYCTGRSLFVHPVIVGECCIVENDNDIVEKKWQRKILVLPNCRPEFSNCFKNIPAFVSDEGGVCSHAAQVAREVMVPAVIGCKNATKIFKDGDVLEIDFKRGNVRKYKGELNV
jgi:phosphohistidine swiveling domain-containing protein